MPEIQDSAAFEALWTVEQFADYISVSKETVYHWRKVGTPHPPAIRLGKHLRWRPEAVRQWVALEEERAF